MRGMERGPRLDTWGLRITLAAFLSAMSDAVYCDGLFSRYEKDPFGFSRVDFFGQNQLDLLILVEYARISGAREQNLDGGRSGGGGGDGGGGGGGGGAAAAAAAAAAASGSAATAAASAGAAALSFALLNLAFRDSGPLVLGADLELVPQQLPTLILNLATKSCLHRKNARVDTSDLTPNETGHSTTKCIQTIVL